MRPASSEAGDAGKSAGFDLVSASPDPAATASEWDSRYAQPSYLFGERPNDFLVQSELLLRRGSRVLVLADGEGRNGVFLAKRGHRVTTVDISPIGVAKAVDMARARGVEIDAHTADLDVWVDSSAAQGPWDGIVWIFCQLPREIRVRVGAALTPRLSQEGWLIIEDYTPGQLQLGGGLDGGDERVTLTPSRVREDWPGLLLDVRLLERRIFEGRGHQGLSSVIQVLGHNRLVGESG